MTESLKLMLGTGFLTLALSATPFSVQASDDEDEVTAEDVQEAAGGNLPDDQAAALAAKSNELGDKEATAEDVKAVLGENADAALVNSLVAAHNADDDGDKEPEKASDGDKEPENASDGDNKSEKASDGNNSPEDKPTAAAEDVQKEDSDDDDDDDDADEDGDE